MDNDKNLNIENETSVFTAQILDDKIDAQDLCDYARAAVGGGYCYGASGEVSSLAMRKKWADWNPGQKTNLLGICAKWDGKHVWDCSGLFRGAWRSLLTYRSGGATMIFNTWCAQTGTIDEMPDIAGIAVFRQGAGNTKQHIGLYVGQGMVVDARGSVYGVLHGEMSGFPWTHWGQLADVAYRTVLAQP